MIDKLFFYGNTIRNMKPSQIVARMKKKLGLCCTLGVRPAPMPKQDAAFQIVCELDFDPVFLGRFDVDEILSGKVTFLHRSEYIDWQGKWHFANQSALWNFNLHYFEFLMPLVSAYQSTHEKKYLQVIQDSISAWIDQNPKNAGGVGWAAYTISLRAVNWLSCWTYLSDEFDPQFQCRMRTSMYEQYAFLGCHLEKDLLTNHYFENLKALILFAIVFQDEKMLRKVLAAFKAQCREQILPDGMHFELSPMYHKLMLEAVMRVAIALRSVQKKDLEVESYIQPMLDVAYTFENGLERIPLFNDGGNNVAKSLSSLMETARVHFGLKPEYKKQLPDSGYYFFDKNDWRLIVDAGAPGPVYNPGHAHCDAMSFELFHHGKPVLVNCGTYAYQCTERGFFRSTAAHNTVMINNTEQSQCWGAFRMAKQSKVNVVSVSEDSIVIELVDQRGQLIKRTIQLGKTLKIMDESSGNKLTAFLHATKEMDATYNSVSQKISQQYAPEYGEMTSIDVAKYEGTRRISVEISL